MARLLLVMPLVVLLAAGCVRARANTRTQPTALDVPPPPARVVVPPEPEPLPDEKVVEETLEPAAKRPVRPRPQPPKERPDAAKGTEVKPDAPPVDPNAVPPAPPPPVTPAEPTLQPLLSGAEQAEMDRQVNQQLAQAQRDLNRVDWRALNTDGKAQYEQAKRFMTQASQAQREKNLPFAVKLAEKAAGLASGLITR